MRGASGTTHCDVLYVIGGALIYETNLPRSRSRRFLNIWYNHLHRHPMSNQVTLLCLVYGRPFLEAFPVTIGNETMIGVLRDVIKEKKSHEFVSFDANHLRLWKTDIQYGDSEELERFEPRDSEVLSPVTIVGNLFREGLRYGGIHIVVKAPGMRKRIC